MRISDWSSDVCSSDLELFNPSSQIFTTADDPCDARFLNGGPDPTTRQATCAAAGLKSDFESHIVDATARGLLSGNPDLDNETAKALTLAILLAPRLLARTSVVEGKSVSVRGDLRGRPIINK